MKQSYTEEDRERIRELRSQGFTLPVIVERTGVPLSTVKTWLMSPAALARRQLYDRSHGRRTAPVSSGLVVCAAAGCDEKLRDPAVGLTCGWCVEERELAEAAAA